MYLVLSFWDIFMNYIARLLIIPGFFIMLVSMAGCDISREQQPKTGESNQMNKDKALPMKLYIIVGSIRPTRTGEKIAKNIKAMMDKRPEVMAEIVYIETYKLPFYTNEIAPASREGEITDPIFRRWSDKINQAEGYIIVSPEYNSGYPASLKNALDSLYKEWNNKPVAFIGYSGGSSGGASMIAQLRQVVRGLEMIPVAADIKIPQSWQAFNEQGGLANSNIIEKELNIIIDQLLAVQNTTKN